MKWKITRPGSVITDVIPLDEKMTQIASCTLNASRNNGPSRVVRISLSKPEPAPNCQHGRTYRTKVCFDEIRKPRYISGEGSLQSLALSLSYLRAALKQASDDGWTFRYQNATEDMDFDLNLFGDEWIAPPDTDPFWDSDNKTET